MLFKTIFPFCFISYTLFYLRHPFIEEKSKFNSIQNSVSYAKYYWMVNFIVDCICHAIICGIFVLIMFYKNILETNEQFMYFYILIITSGIMFILQYYIFAKLFGTLSLICSLCFYGAFFGGKNIF